MMWQMQAYNAIRLVSRNEAVAIIETREPRGLFYTKDGGLYIGIDNVTGDAWTEEFESVRECKRWLRRGREAAGL